MAETRAATPREAVLASPREEVALAEAVQEVAALVEAAALGEAAREGADLIEEADLTVLGGAGRALALEGHDLADPARTEVGPADIDTITVMAAEAVLVVLARGAAGQALVEAIHEEATREEVALGEAAQEEAVRGEATREEAARVEEIIRADPAPGAEAAAPPAAAAVALTLEAHAAAAPTPALIQEAATASISLQVSTTGGDTHMAGAPGVADTATQATSTKSSPATT